MRKSVKLLKGHVDTAPWLFLSADKLLFMYVTQLGFKNRQNGVKNKKKQPHKIESGGRIIIHHDTNDTPFESLIKTELDFGSLRIARDCAGHLQTKTSKNFWQLSRKNDYFWHLSNQYRHNMSHSALWQFKIFQKLILRPVC